MVAHRIDHALRMCINYIRLNRWIRKLAYPNKNIDILLLVFAHIHMLYFGDADMKSAFQQWGCTEHAGELMCFTTEDGLFQPLRLIFGITTGAPAFQRVIDKWVEKAQPITMFIDNAGADAMD